MNIFFLETTAMDIMDVADRDKGFLIEVPDDFLQFRFFQPADDTKDDFFVIAGKGTFPVQVRHRPTEPVHDGKTNLFMIFRNNPDTFRLIESVDDDINRLEGDEVSNQGIHGPVPTEDETGSP